QHHETLRIRVRQRLQQQRIDDAEDRGVGADADRERGNDDEGQHRAASRGTNGVADVLQESAHRWACYPDPWPKGAGLRRIISTFVTSISHSWTTSVTWHPYE